MTIKKRETMAALKRSVSLRGYILGGIAVLFIGLWTSTGYAQKYMASDGTTWAGSSGWGAESYALDCGPAQFLVGMEGRAGSYVNKIQLKCVGINNGKWDGSVKTKSDFAGGSGGQPFDFTCPRDYFVTGFKGNAGTYVDRLQLQCRRFDAGSWKATGSPTYTQSVGGTGGMAFGPLTCKDDQLAIAAWGWDGQWINGLALACKKPYGS